jgi:DNA adenine methylase
MKSIPPILKYTGSKREFFAINHQLIPDCEKYYDPFIGGGSSLPYFARKNKPVIAGDLNSQIIAFWKTLQTNPNSLKKGYRKLRTQLASKGEGAKAFYYATRKKYNKSKDPVVFMFLTRTAINGLIRFNKKGEFNSGFHIKRVGIHPDKMDKIVDRWHVYVKSVSFVLGDYRETIKDADKDSFIFFDPPYYGNVSSLYIADKFDFGAYFDELRRLNSVGVKWILTFNAGKENVVPKDVYTKCVDHLSTSHFKKLGKKEDFDKGFFGDFFNFECENEELLI